MKRRARQIGQPGAFLPEKRDLAPHHSLEQGIDQTDKNGGGEHLRPELRPFGNAA